MFREFLRANISTKAEEDVPLEAPNRKSQQRSGGGLDLKMPRPISGCGSTPSWKSQFLPWHFCLHFCRRLPWSSHRRRLHQSGQRIRGRRSLETNGGFGGSSRSSDGSACHLLTRGSAKRWCCRSPLTPPYLIMHLGEFETLGFLGTHSGLQPPSAPLLMPLTGGLQKLWGGAAWFTYD